MKRLLRPVYAMAVINPGLCNDLSIQVEVEQRDEGPIPHLHVYLDKTRNPRRCAYVRLDKAEYSSHHKSGKRLSRTQKAEFLQVMTEPWNKAYIQSEVTGEIRKATGYEAAVNTWLDTFGDTVKFSYDENGFPRMPNYNSL